MKSINLIKIDNYPFYYYEAKDHQSAKELYESFNDNTDTFKQNFFNIVLINKLEFCNYAPKSNDIKNNFENTLFSIQINYKNINYQKVKNFFSKFDDLKYISEPTNTNKSWAFFYFEKFSDLLAKIFYNPNTLKRYNHATIFGVPVKPDTSKKELTCLNCGLKFHSEKVCTDFLKNIVIEHGKFFKCHFTTIQRKNELYDDSKLNIQTIIKIKKENDDNSMDLSYTFINSNSKKSDQIFEPNLDPIHSTPQEGEIENLKDKIEEIDSIFRNNYSEDNTIFLNKINYEIQKYSNNNLKHLDLKTYNHYINSQTKNIDFKYNEHIENLEIYQNISSKNNLSDIDNKYLTNVFIKFYSLQTYNKTSKSPTEICNINSNSNKKDFFTFLKFLCEKGNNPFITRLTINIGNAPNINISMDLNDDE